MEFVFKTMMNLLKMFLIHTNYIMMNFKYFITIILIFHQKKKQFV
jgi:hypothetical protein